MRWQHMRWDLALAAVVLLGMLAAYGPAGEQAPTYATPQAAFEAAKKAVEKKDYKAVVGTLTEENRDALAGAMVVMGSMVKQFGPKFAKTDEDKAKIQKIETLLEKHGVTAEIAKKAVDLGFGAKGKEPSELMPAIRKLGESVKDRAGLIVGMLALSDQDKKMTGNPFDDLKTAQLKDVRIDGNTAKGMITTTKDGTEKTEPIEFRKEKDSWKIHIDLNKKK